MINYTKSQLEAINYFDSNLIISASAGSGKTQVLLEKVVKLIEKGYKIDEMLIVTFTNLAASEMKTKLENMLETKFCETQDNKFFDALKELNIADISTIHSFCQKLIKKYYYELKINPNFEIKDDNFLFYLKNLALDNTFKQFLSEKDEEFIKLSNLFVFKRDYKLFKEEILSFYDFLVSKVDKYNYIENVIKDNYNKNLDENTLLIKFNKYCEKQIKNFETEIVNLKIESQQIQNEKLTNLCDIVLNILNLDLSSREKFVKTFFNPFDFPRIQISNKSEFDAILIKEKLQKAVKEIKDFIKILNNIFCYDNLDALFVDIQKSEKFLNKFVSVVKRFEENYKLLKKDNNCCDFNDLEELTLKLFENDNILSEVASKFKFVFVDEYQDTNFVQEEILKHIALKSKRIMVGDLKQSIYAFRECNPKILSDKMKEYSLSNEGKVIELNKNFRSRKEILDFSNDIFSNLMRNENCGYDYISHGKFVCGREDEKDLAKIVSVLCLNKKSEKFENLSDCENTLVLNAINNLLNQEIVENGQKRKLTYKDIAIISRKRNDKFNSLCECLQKFKIPTNVKYYEKIFDLFETKIILAYLKIINNIQNEIALYSVLKNIYDLNDNELITIKNNNFVEDVLNYSKKDEISIKLSNFLKDYDYFKRLTGEIDVKSLIKEIIKKTRLELKLLKLNGKISSARLEVFLNNVSTNQYSLSDFLSFVEKIKDKKFEVKKVDGENSVLVDTFHSTKGLEYNAVIIFGAGDNIFSKTRSNLIYNANFGVGIYNFNEENKTKNPNLVYSIIKLLNKQEELNEEIRLLYVALTRAKNFLVVCGSEKQENLCCENNPLKFLNFSSYLSLICSSKFEDFVDFEFLEDEDKIFEKESLNEVAKEEINLDYKIFDEIFDKQYAYNYCENIQLKNSVTSLSEEDNYIYNITNFKVTDLDKEDFIAVGNAYHHCFEKLSFNLKTQKEIHNKIVNLIENGLLEENVFSYIDVEKILKALTSISKLIKSGDKISKEKIFLMNINYNKIIGKQIEDKILIQGIIDLMIEKEDEIVLIDYKTSRLNDINLIKKYSLQLSLYEKAISEKFKGKKISKYIYSIFLDKLINVV